MEDRELLELAARAIGGVYDETGFISTDGGIEFHQWEPLEDGDDALQLLTSLAARFDAFLQLSNAKALCDFRGGADYAEEPSRGDLATATRRAIVRAAAEIGKQANTEGRG